MYAITADAAPLVALRDLPSPADIGYDARRNRVLVPLFTPNEVRIVPLPAPAALAGPTGAAGAPAATGAAPSTPANR